MGHEQGRPPEDKQHGGAGAPNFLKIFTSDATTSRRPAGCVDMDDFEYSLQISDRDWECFFAECEECNILPPSLAGVDESGISDIDDARSVLANRISKDEITAGLVEADRTINSPPVCEALPTERGIGGLHSILSGSEEDIHLQTVNIFFEKLNSFGEPSQVSVHDQEACSDERQASSILTLNSLPANSDTADGKENTQIFSGPAASNSPIEAKTPAGPETQPCSETRRNEVMQQIHSLTAHSGNEAKAGACSPPEEVKQSDLVMDCSGSSGLEIPTSVNLSKNVQFVPSQARGVNKQASQELSPSPCMKRKRRRKRRISAEHHESVYGYERQVLRKQSDSEDDNYPPRGGFHLSQTEGLVAPSTTHPTTENPSVKKGEELSQSFAPPNGQHQCLPESWIRQEQFRTRLSQQSLVKEMAGVFPALPGSAADSIRGESGMATKTGDSLQSVRSDVTDRPVTGSENGPSTQCCTAEVKSMTLAILPSASDPAMEVSQHDKLSSGQSVLTVQARHSDGDFDAVCQGQNEPLQQLEISHQDKDQYSPTSKQFTTVEISSEWEEVPVQPSYNKVPVEVAHVLMSDTRGVSPDNSRLSKSASNAEINTAKVQEEHSVEAQTLSKAAVLLEKPELIMPQAGVGPSDENHLGGISKIQTGPTFSGGLIRNPANILPLLSKCDSGGSITTSRPECETEKHSAYTMSSFWHDMEKLTIKDILDLRNIGAAAPHKFLPPLQESDTGETDSGFFTQPESEQTSEDACSVHTFVDSNSGSGPVVDHSSSGGVRWESEPVPLSTGAVLYPSNMLLSPFSDISLPVLSGSAEKCPRKISKNVSVHNLHALDSQALSAPLESQQTCEKKKLEKELDNYNLIGGRTHTQDDDTDCLPSSLMDSYRISLTDIFSSLFGSKQSIPSQPAATIINPSFTDGESVSESYDHFFSEFDTETFFCPQLQTADQDNDRLVPIFSCSRLSRGKFQFPDAYDYFFVSSSSDDSSADTEEEDNKDDSPMKVVTRFSRKTSAAASSADVYENFFTDSDLEEDFFWKSPFSFRNRNFTGPAAHRQRSEPLALQPVRQKGRSALSTVYGTNALGNQDVLLPDPLLHHLEDRISTQLVQQPCLYGDLQIAAPNPRLDASLLPLRQSDMCLVCIAFASWVLKSANLHTGDAWKAVLLANVSALSAIRYLRKYVTVEAVDGEKKVHHEASV